MSLTKERLIELRIKSLERYNDRLHDIATTLLVVRAKHRVDVGDTDSFAFDEEGIALAFKDAVRVLSVGSQYEFSTDDMREFIEEVDFEGGL